MALNRKFLESGAAAWLRAALFGVIAAGVNPPAAAAAPSPYLALGDSVAFGYITDDGYAYANAANFLGYPFWLAGAMQLRSVNAACPGETTGSFISSSAPDNGCRQFRSQAPLHVTYGGTQLAFAATYLSHHKDTGLVSIGLGANDIFLLQNACNGNVTCIENGLPAALAGIATNMGAIISSLLATGYRGPIVIVNYYSTDYTNAVTTAVVAALNETLSAVGAAFGLPVADVFTAFQTASAAAGGVTCMAGLLNVNPANTAQCDVHPAQSGQHLMSQTLRATLTSISP